MEPDVPPSPSPLTVWRARPARRRCTRWARTRNTTRRPSPRIIVTMPGISPSLRPSSPRIALAVLLENSGFGGSNAAPVARQVLDAFLLGDDGKLKPEYEPSAESKAVLEKSAPEADQSADTRAMIREEKSPKAQRPPRRHRRRPHAAGAEAGWAAAGGSGVDCGLWPGGALQRLGQSLGTVIRQVGHLGMGTVAMLLLAQVNPNFLRRLVAVAVPARCPVAADRRRHGRHRQGRAALAGPGSAALPAVGNHEARGADDVRLVSAGATVAAKPAEPGAAGGADPGADGSGGDAAGSGHRCTDRDLRRIGP